MPRKEAARLNGRYYYDERRRASEGKWVVVIKGAVIVHVQGYHTEAEARQALGLKGGNTDRRYVPD